MHDDVDNLDAFLSSHLKRELDPHVGSALKKFDLELRPTLHLASPSEQANPTAYPSFWASRVRYAAAAVLMLGIGVAGSLVYRNLNAHTPSLPIAVDSKPVPFEGVQSSWTQTYDQGTVMIDPQTPARMLRRVQYEKTDWKDQNGKWQTRIDIPHEDVILVDMPKQ